jgi:hypothetical protein
MRTKCHIKSGLFLYGNPLLLPLCLGQKRDRMERWFLSNNGQKGFRLGKTMLVSKEHENEEVLLRVVDTGLQELIQPMRAVLCWSTLLLSETESQSSIAMDLEIIVDEAARMNEIIRGLDLLTKNGETL